MKTVAEIGVALLLCALAFYEGMQLQRKRDAFERSFAGYSDAGVP